MGLAEVADRLHMNERSLGRQLQKEGTSFRKIKQDYFLDQALAYLQDQSINITEIAEIMGYSETCAFMRAFQRQTGMTPGQYRKKRFGMILRNALYNAKHQTSEGKIIQLMMKCQIYY